MTTNAEMPHGQGAAFREDSAAGGASAATVAQGEALRVHGRLDAYRSRAAKWHHQVAVEKCPRCGHPHLHRAPGPLVQTVPKLAPCGAAYVVVLRTDAEAA